MLEKTALLACHAYNGRKMTEKRHSTDRREITLSPQDLRTATYLLQSYPLGVSDAARLIIELLENSSGFDMTDSTKVLQYCRTIIGMGLQSHQLSRQTVSFKDAVAALLLFKNSVRKRTLSEIRQICKRIMFSDSAWEKLTMRQIDTKMCQHTIEHTFPTVPMQRKARRILHAVFSYAKLNGWCSVNPLDLVVLPAYKERPIRALSIAQIISLLETVKKKEYRECAAAVGLMLWAGIRPQEIERLHFRDIRFEDRVITIPPYHSKTGGSRHVILYPPLHYWLTQRALLLLPEVRIVPRNWVNKWAKVRKAAGFHEWVPDVLRHTFASYHLKYFRDIGVLQLDMGHSTPQQLRTRYLAMENVTKEAAKIFWEYGVPRSPK